MALILRRIGDPAASRKATRCRELSAKKPTKFRSIAAALRRDCNACREQAERVVWLASAPKNADSPARGQRLARRPALTNRPPRMLIYSHNSFGLGHLRRCRAIAQSLVAYRDDLSILMIVGSPIVGAFSFSPNVEFIRVPGVVKIANESYQPHSPGLSIEDLMAIRSAIILETARVFEPDIFLVDKEPLGLRGEVEATLRILEEEGKAARARSPRRHGRSRAPCRGMGPQARAPGARRTSTITSGSTASRRSAIRSTGIEVSDAVRQKTRFTGYLRRGKTPSGLYPPPHEIEEPFFLVTTGGGGDGAMLVDWVLRAYEFDPTLDMPAKIVLGPFMGTSQQTGFMERVARLKHVEAIAFEANMEALMQRALGVVAMGGYNTFCEILSFDKRALIVPRTARAPSNIIRAKRADELGLVSMLMPDDTHRSAPDGGGAARASLPAAAVEGAHPRPARRAFRHQQPRRPISRRQMPAGARPPRFSVVGGAG